jgi:glutathione S-transferase
MTGELPVLYSFRRCPYAIRARMALCYSGVRVELREVVLREMPRELQACSPKGTVPVLQLPDGAVLEESRDIMDWALAQYDPDQWRPQPGSPAAAAAQHLIDANDLDFKPLLDRGWFDAAPRTRLRNWLNGLLQAELFTAVMCKYPQWRSGDPVSWFP